MIPEEAAACLEVALLNFDANSHRSAAVSPRATPANQTAASRRTTRQPSSRSEANASISGPVREMNPSPSFAFQTRGPTHFFAQRHISQQLLHADGTISQIAELDEEGMPRCLGHRNGRAQAE